MPASILVSRPSVQRLAIVVAGLTAATVFSSAGLAHAADASAARSVSASAVTVAAEDVELNLSEQEVATLEGQFAIVDSIPDSVLESGNAATKEWLIMEGFLSPTADGKDYTQPVPEGWWETAKCAAAIATFIGTNLVSASKLLKIKKYIKELGGIKKSAKLMLKASTWSERLQIGGNALVGLAAELLGYSLIKNNC